MSAYKYLLTIPYADFGLWDYKRYANSKMSSQFKFEYLGKHIINQNKKEILSDRPKEKYGILGVNNKTGMFDAYEELGENINQAYKICENDYIAYNPYRVNVGSIGIKKNELQYRYISPAYVVFSCKKTLNPNFLYMVLKSNYFHSIICDNTSGSVRQNLTFGALSNMKIPLPTLEEQEHIVTEYESNINKAIEMCERANMLIASVDDVLFKELGIERVKVEEKSQKFMKIINFYSLSQWGVDKNIILLPYKYVGWSPISFNENQKIFVDVFRGKSPKYSNKSSKIILNQKCNRWDEIEIEHAKCVDEEWLKNVNAEHFTTEGDIVVNSTGEGTIGRSSYISNKNEGLMFDSHVLLIRVNKDIINSQFLVYQFNSEFVQNQINMLKGAQATNQTELGVKNVKSIRLMIPPLDIQNAIVGKISELKDEIKELHSKSDELMIAAQKIFEEGIYGE